MNRHTQYFYKVFDLTICDTKITPQHFQTFFLVQQVCITLPANTSVLAVQIAENVLLA